MHFIRLGGRSRGEKMEKI